MVAGETSQRSSWQRDRPDPRQVLAALSMLFDVLPDGVFVAEPSSAIVYLNPAARELLGLTPGAPAATAAEALAHMYEPGGQPPAAEERPLALALRGESAAGLHFLLPREGEQLDLRISFAPLRRDEEIAGAILYAADRTAQTRIERTRDDFLASIAHDLRSPLTAIRGSAQLALRWVQRELPDGGPLLRSLANIDAAANRLNRMLETLLDSARLARAGVVVQRGPTDLVALVEEVVEHYRRESPRHRLVLETPADPLTGDWDAALLERAIENLVGNAVKYSPNGGQVTVRCIDDGDGWVSLVVRDQGVGIPADALPHIFDQFYRAKTAGFGEIEGNGLGLFAVKGIVTAHGGTVTATSVEGEGTEMTVRLPRQAPPERGTAA